MRRYLFHNQIVSLKELYASLSLIAPKYRVLGLAIANLPCMPLERRKPAKTRLICKPSAYYKIDSDSTFNGGSFDCTVSYATGSVTQVFNQIWLYVLKHLTITYYPISPR